MNPLVRRLAVAAVVALPILTMAQTDLGTILADPSRPDEHRSLDATRSPAEIIEFLGIGLGDRVADVLAGGGYYTRILVPLVGDEGRVYAGNNSFFAEFYADAFDALLSEPAFRDVARIDGPVDEIDLPMDGSLDAVIISQAYHDLALVDEDRNEMNRRIHRALRSGGVYGVTDHAATPGSGTSDTESLHRIDRQLVIDEITSAGFELAAEADILANPEDDRTVAVFDPAVRRNTDRFVLRFEKP